MNIETIGTPRKQKKFFIEPIKLPADQDEGMLTTSHQYINGNVCINRNGMQITNTPSPQTKIYDVEQVVPKMDFSFINKVFSGQSPQEFVTPMRYNSCQFHQDKDGFFIPLPKKAGRQQPVAPIPACVFQNIELKVKLEDLQSINTIGQGSSGRVDKAIHLPTNTPIALKNVQIISDETFTKQINLELNTLVSCNHPNIIKCYGAFLNSGAEITIAMEYMDLGNLADVLRQCGTIPEGMLGFIAFQVLKGLDYLHRTIKLIHRDIKPCNLLINSQGIVKISDFGVSGQLMNSKDSRSTWIGTVTYMSPERFRGESYSWDTDLWSLGLTILECAWGRFPYPFVDDPLCQNKQLGFWELLEYINQKPTPKLPQQFSCEMQQLVDLCLQKDRTQRRSASDLLELPVMSRYNNVDINFLKNWLTAS